MTARIISDMRGLESIAPEWNMLAGNFGTSRLLPISQGLDNGI